MNDFIFIGIIFSYFLFASLIVALFGFKKVKEIKSLICLCQGCGKESVTGEMCPQCMLESCMNYWLEGCYDCKNLDCTSKDNPNKQSSTPLMSAALSGVSMRVDTDRTCCNSRLKLKIINVFKFISTRKFFIKLKSILSKIIAGFKYPAI